MDLSTLILYRCTKPQVQDVSWISLLYILYRCTKSQVQNVPRICLLYILYRCTKSQIQDVPWICLLYFLYRCTKSQVHPVGIKSRLQYRLFFQSAIVQLSNQISSLEVDSSLVPCFALYSLYCVYVLYSMR